MFVDKAKVIVKGGDGGNGCCSFRREKFVPKGGPDGGDGGGGGNVILRTCTGEQSLVDFVYNRHFMADRGPHGKGKDMHGRKAGDIILRVPVGTVIRNAETGELIADMDQADVDFIIAHGGRGGRGNARFATAHNRVPRESEEGLPGEELNIELELKTIADVGLVGFPNAGKSTLLGAVSHAHPKVAPYPFTTLHPVVGVVELPGYGRMTVADIPGLIDGAHDNVGLGHAFLKHIERTHVLAYVLDMGGVDGRLPWEDFRHLQNELELYMKGLSKRPAVIVANKMDLPASAENLELLRDELASETLEIIPVTACIGEHIDTFIEKVRQMVAESVETY
ncbi:MAG: GTPase ObgE [Victivallaceae bacterium]